MGKNIETAIGVLNSHDLIEEANKLNKIARRCTCRDCKDYRYNIEVYDQFFLAHRAKREKS